jgi:hypothetical protein
MCRGHAPWGHGRAAERTAAKLRSRSIATPGRASRLGFDSFSRLFARIFGSSRRQGVGCQAGLLLLAVQLAAERARG